MPYQNQKTGETISDEEYQSRFGSSSETIKTPQTGAQPGGFLQRLKLSFGGPEAREQIRQIEEQQGTRGRLDVGDLADVAGAAIPAAGAVAGGVLGLGGSAVGAAAGQGVRRLIGGLIGADQPTGTEIAKDVAVTGIGTYVGGRILTPVFNAIVKNVPNKLISTIFKQSADDIAKEVKSSGKNLTQAEEILREGFRGDSRTMMGRIVNTMKDLEQQAQGIVQGKTFTLQNKKGYISLISNYIGILKKTSYGFEQEISREGKTLLRSLQKIRGDKIPGELALRTRRFIDSIRRTSSFKVNPQLSPLEATYKKAADSLRQNLARQIPGLSEIMGRYKVHIDAFEDLAKYAAKTQNKDIFDLVDVFIMYGIDPTAYLGRRGLSSAFLKTNIAQGLYQAGRLFGRTPTGLIPEAATRGGTRLFQSD